MSSLPREEDAINSTGTNLIMNKKQREQRKQQLKEEVQRRKKRKQTLVRGGLLSIVGILLLASGYFVWFYKSDSSRKETLKGTLRIATPQYNFGVVSVRKGTVSAEIPLVTIGEGDVTITALDSSCGCTTARIINQGVEGPIFRMAGHGNNPKNWKSVMKPGEQAMLQVFYDPTVHPDLRGPATRVVTVYSDDPLTPAQQVRIEVKQIE